MQKYQSDLEKVEPQFKTMFEEAQFYPDQLRQEIFEPPQPWSKWQQTDEYLIQVSS
jgi:hypothetical protein